MSASRPGRRRRRRPGPRGGIDWEFVGGAIIAVAAIVALVVLLLINAEPDPAPVIEAGLR